MSKSLIAAKRRARGLKQSELADAIDVHVVTVKRYEAGQPPRRSVLPRLKDVLGLTEEEVRTLAVGDAPEAAPLAEDAPKGRAA
jgi:transcriptional regulator with XRE-family HTH domain